VILALRRVLRVSPSSANFLIPSWSLSKAICSWRSAQRNSGSLSMKETLAMGSAWAAINGSISSFSRAGADRYAPRPTSSLLGTASVDFFSSSRRAGEMVRKSIPASDLISPTYGMISQGHSEILNLTCLHFGKKHP
jgi:hypothetical protein